MYDKWVPLLPLLKKKNLDEQFSEHDIDPFYYNTDGTTRAIAIKSECGIYSIIYEKFITDSNIIPFIDGAIEEFASSFQQ